MTSNKKLLVFIQAEIDNLIIETEYAAGNWKRKAISDNWNAGYNYRIKSEPREWYVNEYPEHLGYKGFGYLHPTRKIADNHGDSSVIRVIHVKEVLE